jgi:alginate O-acetyltransferase complex protein AlgI
LGISFYTFTQIGYLVDVKQGVARNRGPFNYALFVTFFPHLIAGPILHNREIMPQFADERTYRFSSANLAVGTTIFVIGLLKKTIFADPLSTTVASGFSHAGDLSLVDSWHTALCYSLQLYFDFSGYSDMAIGLARMFNVRFPVNFDSPYKSASIIEFWQRWHMTLTRYLTLFLYNPLAMWVTRARAERGLPFSRKAHSTPGGFASMVMFPTFVTMALIGVWHGAGLQFLIFGLLHGCYLTINHAAKLLIPRKHGAVDTIATHVAKVAVTYLAVLFAVMFFRAPSTEAAVHMIGGMIGLHGTGAFSIRFADLIWMGLLYGIVWGMPNTQQIMCRYEPILEKVRASALPWLSWRPSMPWAIAVGFGVSLAILGIGGTTEFLYFQF